MGKRKCYASIAIDGRIDVFFEVDENATKEEIKMAALSAFADAPLTDMEVIGNQPVNYTINGKLTDF